MIGWRVQDWSKADWSQVDNYADFWKAANERRALCQAARGPDSGQFPVPVVGSDCQYGGQDWPQTPEDHFSLHVLQEYVQYYCHYFVQSHDLDGTPRSPSYYEGKTQVEMWTFENLISAIYGGKAKGHFRRATTIPANWTDVDDPAFEFGYIQAPENYAERDYIGPWLFHDLQKALNMMVWTLFTLSSKSSCGIAETRIWPGDRWLAYGEGYSWQEAIESAQANWQADDEVTEEAMAQPGAWTRGTIIYEDPPARYGMWPAQATRARVRLLNVSATCQRKASFLIRAHRYADAQYQEWSANGSPVVEDELVLFEEGTQQETPTATFYSDTHIGNTDFPEPCQEPQPPAWTLYSKGWEIGPFGDVQVIVRWDVPGGLTHQG